MKGTNKLMNEDLPSINDFIEDNSNLPSINDFIEDNSNLPSINESVDENLPSYKDFLEKKEEIVEEEILTEEVVPQQTVVHEQTIIREVQDNSVIISLIEQVRDSIPEVKSYDKELFDLVNLIEELRKEIPVVPEPPMIPEVKYYDDEIASLKEEVKSVKERDIPDFRWISKSFTTIDEDIDSVNSNLSILKNRLDMEIGNLVESIDITKFETGIETKSLNEKYESVDSKVDSIKENLTETLDDVKSKIYKELRDASLRIWNVKKDFQEDDKKIKKELGGQYKKLSESINEILNSQQEKNTKVDAYFEGLKEEIDNLPEVKYYDEDINQVNESVKSVKNLVEVLENKLNKKINGLKESILVVPPTDNNTDPLTPLDQNFATLEDLSSHYRLFLNRIQQQLASLGGGGETRLEFLDDVDRDSVKVDGKVIAYQASTGKFIGVTNSGGGGAGIGSTSILYDGSTVRVEATDYGALTTGISSATNVSIANTFTYPEYITGGMVPRAIKCQGGYDRTLRFVDHQTGQEASQDPADYVEYTQELASTGTWKRLGITTAGNQANDNDWWGETNPDYDQSKGLFGGLTNPAGVDRFFDFDDNTVFNNAKTTGDLKYTQAVGSFSLKECQVGDLVLARFDLNIMPMVTNTTVELALIYVNRDSNDTITNEFPLTITPFTYGGGTVGKGFLLRPTISAYIANDQDINSRSLLAIKADNPILVNPIGVLFTIQR